MLQQFQQNQIQQENQVLIYDAPIISFIPTIPAKPPEITIAKIIFLDGDIPAYIAAF